MPHSFVPFLPLRALVAAAVVALAAMPARGSAQAAGAAVNPAGLYDAFRYKGRPLPTMDQLAEHKGFAHRVRLESMSVTLLADGRFRATANYAHDFRAKIDRRPLGAPLFESAQGRWVRRGNVITFVPQKGKKSPPTRPIMGTLVNGGMVVRYEMVTPQGEVVPLRVEFRKTGD
ncbi:MAG TPA: hypothetical protein VGD77_05595 [Gemmatimonadaceae bacterium]